MEIQFMGTRGFIKLRSKKHSMHTSTVIRDKRSRTAIIIDLGSDWNFRKQMILKRLAGYTPIAILITHWHPDHIEGLRDLSIAEIAPIYTTKKTAKFMTEEKFPIMPHKLLTYEHRYKIGSFVVTPYEVIHTKKYDAVGYKIALRGTKIFVCHDIIAVVNRRKAFHGISAYIGDGATIAGQMVRKSNGILYGHASVKTQSKWCTKCKFFVTHCGSEITENHREAKRRIHEISPNIILAEDNVIASITK